MKYEIRQLDAWGNNAEGYEINTSYLMGILETHCKAKNDKQAALKEATCIKKFLLECIDLGLCEVWPGWCTSYKSRNESIKAIKQAIRDMKEEIRDIPTWEHCGKQGGKGRCDDFRRVDEG